MSNAKWKLVPAMHEGRAALATTEATDAIAPTEREAFENACRKLAAMPEHAHEKLFGNDDLDTWWALWKEARCTPSPKAPAPSVEQANATSKAACDSCGGEGLIGSHACPDCCDAPQALSVGQPLTDEQIEHHANAATTARGRRWWTFNRDELITFARALQSAHTAGGQS